MMNEPEYSRTGIARLVAATGHSMRGLRAAWRNEEAIRQEIALIIVLTPAAFWVGTNAVEYSLLIGTLLLIMITELLNSAIESTVDRIGTEHHELSGRAKDIGSAAVFVSMVLAGLTWALLLYARLAPS